MLRDPRAIEFDLLCLQDEPNADVSDKIHALKKFLRSLRKSIAQSLKEHMLQAVTDQRCAHPGLCVKVGACRLPLDCDLPSRHVELGNLERVTRELIIHMERFSRQRSSLQELSLAWWRFSAYVCSPRLHDHPAELSETRTAVARKSRKPLREVHLAYDWSIDGKWLEPVSTRVVHVVDGRLIEGLVQRFEAEHGRTQGSLQWVSGLLDLTSDQVRGYIRPKSTS